MNTQYEMAKFEYRNENRAYDAVIAALEAAAAQDRLKRKDIAKKIEMDPGQFSRLLSGPSNWTLGTISNLLFAIGAEMEFNVVDIAKRQKSSVQHYLSGDVDPIEVRIGGAEDSTRSGTEPNNFYFQVEAS
jgi:DNA-binding phage protein